MGPTRPGNPRRSRPLAGSEEPPRLVIENVTPAVNAGRHPAKRLIHEGCEVGADIYKDGHDRLEARIAFRGPGDRTWSHAPLAYDFDSDRWRGRFAPDRIGSWRFTIEAWTDLFGTWREELAKKVEAGFDVESELLEGSALVESAARRASGDAAARLAKAASLLRERGATHAERTGEALSEELQALMEAHVDHALDTRADREWPLTVDRERAGFAAWYEMFPRSQSATPGKAATFAEAARRLPDLAALGFDVIYLPPIHPIGRSHRKGRNNAIEAGPGDPGSPWAIGGEAGGHTAVDPALGTIDDFERFVRTCEALGMEVALDYALQCSPDHPWIREHPGWFFVRPDGSIKHAENPPKKYEDIVPLNFWCEEREALWNACRDILLFWIRRGVKTFRVDNPHTKPYAFWEWVIADVQRDHPETVFLSEAFTRPKRMLGLTKVGFTQSYTYFTWRNSAAELREYLTELTRTEIAEYFRWNFFTNTPDILHAYLQEGGPPAFRVRLLLAATLSPLYGIYSGFELCENVPLREGSEEYLDSEKYQIRARDWNAPGNLNADLRKLNRIRRENPALHGRVNLDFLDVSNPELLVYRRHAPGNEILVVANLDPHRPQEGMVKVPLHALGLGPEETFEVEDLLTGSRYAWRGEWNYVRLDPKTQPGHVLRLRTGGSP